MGQLGNTHAPRECVSRPTPVLSNRRSFFNAHGMAWRGMAWHALHCFQCGDLIQKNPGTHGDVALPWHLCLLLCQIWLLCVFVGACGLLKLFGGSLIHSSWCIATLASLPNSSAKPASRPVENEFWTRRNHKTHRDGSLATPHQEYICQPEDVHLSFIISSQPLSKKYRHRPQITRYNAGCNKCISKNNCG